MYHNANSIEHVISLLSRVLRPQRSLRQRPRRARTVQVVAHRYQDPGRAEDDSSARSGSYSSDNGDKFPKGTYQHVTLVWLGSGDYAEALPPGVKLTRDKRVWDTAKAAWLNHLPVLDLFDLTPIGREAG